MNLKIIIVTHNGLSYIDKCLDGCNGHDVIIVDNNSSDDTVSYIEENFKSVHLIKSPKNLGFGKANNVGIIEARKQNADYVYLLNQDAYLLDNCIDKLVAIHQKNKEYGILSPLQIQNNTGLIDTEFGSLLNYNINPNFISDLILAKNQLKDIYDFPFLHAAGWLIPEQTLKIVGGFDPIFFHYGEDDNYCHRVLYHGLKIGLVPDALMIHDRASRPKRDFSRQSVEYFSYFERRLKKQYADINKDNNRELVNLIKRIRKRFLKELLKLNFNEAKLIKSELQIISNNIELIQKSRALNKKVYPTYLEERL